MKRIFALLIMLALAMLCSGALAAGLSDLIYESDGSGITITGCAYAASGELVIPAEIDGMPVKSIGSGAFNYCDHLTSVTIPYGVTSIGNYAFYYCEALKSVTIPSSVTSIGSDAFSRCYSLTGVTIPSSVTSIGDFTFAQCTNLKSVTIPSSVTSIGQSAFSNCEDLTSVTIPSSVTSIGQQAFASCDGLTSVTIPASVTRMDSHVFDNCSSLTTVTFAAAQPPAALAQYQFNYCENLTTILVPEGSEATYEAALADQIRWLWLEQDGNRIQIKTRLLDGCKVVGFALPASLPRTGDSSSLALWIALLLAAGIGVFAMKRRAA